MNLPGAMVDLPTLTEKVSSVTVLCHVYTLCSVCAALLYRT
jgi:hypothetical protein